MAQITFKEIQSRMKQAEKFGFDAYGVLESAAPAFNADVVALVKDLPVGNGAAMIFEAYTDGWDGAAEMKAMAELGAWELAHG